MSIRSLYLASASREAAVVAHHIGRLRRAGFSITHDWTESVLHPSNRGDSFLTKDDRIFRSLADAQGVLAADCLWILAPFTDSKRCWVELGIAIGANASREKPIRIIISGFRGTMESTIFTEFCNPWFTRHDEVYEWLENERGGP